MTQHAMIDATPTTDLFEIIRTTRSMRRLKPDPVPNELIRKILQAGVSAPSGGNMQRWRFLLNPRSEGHETVGACTSALGTSRSPHGIGLVNRPLV
jgi:nitroreductase